MAKAVKLELTLASGTIEFSVEGQLLPRWVPVYKAASNPREITNLRLEWVIRGARVETTTDGSLWANGTPLAALRTALLARGSAQITGATLKYVATGAVLDEITTGAGFQNIVVNSVEGMPDPTVPQEAWNRSGFLTITISGEKANADTNGLVQFNQRVIEEYDDAGFRHLTWITELSTAEGTDVRTKAETYARIPDAAVGADDGWETNGPNGVDVETLDADEPNNRVPTKARCRSKIRGFGVAIGATSAGGAPGFVRYEVVTESDPTGTTQRTTAFARGPNAEQWVEGNGHAPAVFTSEIVVNAPDKNEFTHVWIYHGAVMYSIRVEVLGGFQTFRYEPLAAALYPIRFDGAFVPARLEVNVMIRRNNPTRPSRRQMALPGLLPDPWELDRSATEETEPYRVEGDLWERKARIIYWCPFVPDLDDKVEDLLNTSDKIESYKFGDLVGSGGDLGGLNNFSG